MSKQQDSQDKQFWSKEEWYLVYQELNPGGSSARFDQDWDDFVKLKAARLRESFFAMIWRVIKERIRCLFGSRI